MPNKEQDYFEVNYTSNHKSRLVYMGSDRHVVEALTSQENLENLKECTSVQSVTIIARGGQVTTFKVQ